jgi:hypothetical protein
MRTFTVAKRWEEEEMVKSWLFDIFNYPYVPTAEGFDPQKC